jgi:ankyrin repeat protein
MSTQGIFMKYYNILIFLIILVIQTASLSSMSQDLTTMIFNSIDDSKEEDIIALITTMQFYVNAADDMGRTLLHCAVERNYCQLVELLLTKGAPVNATTVLMQRTPLYYAVQKNSKEMVKLLLNHKANINQADINGETPLHRSFIDNYFDIANLLIEHNADTSLQDLKGCTPLNYALPLDYCSLSTLALCICFKH